MCQPLTTIDNSEGVISDYDTAVALENFNCAWRIVSSNPFAQALQRFKIRVEWLNIFKVSSECGQGWPSFVFKYFTLRFFFLVSASFSLFDGVSSSRYCNKICVLLPILFCAQPVDWEILRKFHIDYLQQRDMSWSRQGHFYYEYTLLRGAEFTTIERKTGIQATDTAAVAMVTGRHSRYSQRGTGGHAIVCREIFWRQSGGRHLCRKKWLSNIWDTVIFFCLFLSSTKASRFVGNSVSNTLIAVGGAIMVVESTVMLLNCTFSVNSARATIAGILFKYFLVSRWIVLLCYLGRLKYSLPFFENRKSLFK